MVRLTRSKNEKRARDNGRPLLVIGRGKTKKQFHLSEAEVWELRDSLERDLRPIVTEKLDGARLPPFRWSPFGFGIGKRS